MTPALAVMWRSLLLTLLTAAGAALMVPPANAAAVRSEHECLASYAVSRHWQSVSVVVQQQDATDRGVLVSLLTVFSRRRLSVQLSAAPDTAAAGCPPDGEADGTMLLRPSGGARLCPRGALHAWTEARRAGRGGLTFSALRWDGAAGRMVVVDSVNCFSGLLTAQPAVRYTTDFRGVLRGVHVSVSTIGWLNGRPMDGRGGGITNLVGQEFRDGEGKLLHYLSEMLGFSYSVQLVSDELTTDSFNLQESMLANNSFDMTTILLTQTARRAAMIRLSFPTMIIQDRVAIRTPRLTRRPFEPSRPFSRSAWIGVMLLVTLISLWMAGCQTLLIASAAERQRGSSSSRGSSACRREAAFVAGWWALVAMACRQYERGLSPPARASAALFGFLCFGFTFLVSSYYSSVIPSFMALEHGQLPYASVRDGVSSGQLHVSYPKGGVMERKVQSAGDPLLRLIARRERARPSSVDFFSQQDQLCPWLQAGPQHGYLLSNFDLQRHREIHRAGEAFPVCLLPELVATRLMGIAYSRRFAHSRTLDLQLLRLREYGLLPRLGPAVQQQQQQPLCQLQTEAARWQPLGLDDLSAVLAVLPIGAAAALLVLAVERAVHLISRVAADGRRAPDVYLP